MDRASWWIRVEPCEATATQGRCMAGALICMSNCDKITPGMLLATLRFNIPTIFVSGEVVSCQTNQMSSTS